MAGAAAGGLMGGMIESVVRDQAPVWPELQPVIGRSAWTKLQMISQQVKAP